VRCSRCGFCCVKYETILLTKEEVKEKKFKMKRYPTPPSWNSDFSSKMVLKTKKVYISFLGKVKEVCWYFDGMTSLCVIHSDKPQVCQQFLCSKRR